MWCFAWYGATSSPGTRPERRATRYGIRYGYAGLPLSNHQNRSPSTYRGPWDNQGLRTPISFSQVVKIWFARLACRIRDAISALSLVRLGAWHIPGVLTGSRRTLWGLIAPVYDIEVVAIWKVGDKKSQTSTQLHTLRVVIFESMSGLCSELDNASKTKHVH